MRKFNDFIHYVPIVCQTNRHKISTEFKAATSKSRLHYFNATLENYYLLYEYKYIVRHYINPSAKRLAGYQVGIISV